MSVEDPKDEVGIDSDLVTAYAEWAQARDARLKWEAREKFLKDKILNSLYDPEDPKPHSIRALTPKGQPAFDVSVSPRRGLDFQYFKKTYPHIYAECEKSTWVKTFKEPPSEPQVDL